MDGTSDRRIDTTIVGGGLAGLCAAVTIARAGRSVTVFERSTEPGGRARSDTFEGAIFNRGAHALHNDGPGHRTLRSLGVEPSGSAPPLAGSQALVGGTTQLLPTGPASLLRTPLLSVGSKVRLGSVLAGLGRTDPSDHCAQTVDEWIGGHQPDAQALLRALSRLSTYSATPEIQSAEATIAQLQGSDRGVLYLDGGWGRLVDQLTEAARAVGATIRTGERIVAAPPADGGFRIETDDDVVHARTVIVASGGPSHAADLLDLAPTAFADAGPAQFAAVLDLVLDEMPAHRFVLGLDEPVYFSVHSPPADLAPPGRVAAVAMRYLHPDDDGAADAHRTSLERVAAAAGVGTPIGSRFLRRMPVTHGLPLASSGGYRGRPPVVVAQRPGAYVAGDWVGPDGLLADAAICSGVRAGAAALERLSGSAERTAV